MEIKMEDPNFTFIKVDDKCGICGKEFKRGESIQHIQEGKAYVQGQDDPEDIDYPEPPDPTLSKVMMRNGKFSKFATIHTKCR